MTVGLVIGKFMPFHMGHKLLLDTALANCSSLHVVVCSLPTEPIPGSSRFKWITDAYPSATVHHLNDPLMPQEPKDHADFWNIWRTKLLGFNFKYDLVFSSEDYGFELARQIGIAQQAPCEHFIVDKARVIIPTSGTKVRANPFDNWDYQTSPAKQFFNKGILITGPESCGKTTMAELLAKHFNTVWCPEFAREYLSDLLFDFNNDDLVNIAEGHDRILEAAQVFAERVFFSDTCALETSIYSEHYLGRVDNRVKRMLQKQKSSFGLVIILKPTVPWVKDSLRNLESTSERDRFYQLFLSQIKTWGVPYVEVTAEDYGDRVSCAIDAVNKSIASWSKE